MDGVDVRVGFRGGRYFYEVGYIFMRVGVWRYVRGGDVFWRCEVGVFGVFRFWVGL